MQKKKSNLSLLLVIRSLKKKFYNKKLMKTKYNLCKTKSFILDSSSISSLIKAFVWSGVKNK